MIDVLIINLNCLEHTQNIINDLRKQTYKNFDLTVLDQASKEDGTKEYLRELKSDRQLEPIVVRHDHNIPINTLWNNHVEISVHPIICILNNDIRIPSNFMKDIVEIFSKNENVGAIIHPTNHPDYSNTTETTKYEILERGKYRQGWDISIRKNVWTPIPDNLKIYCGDDFIFENMYNKGYDCAIATSSPIIHYLGQTRKSPYNVSMPERNPKQDIANYRAMGYIHHMVPPPHYSIVDFAQSPVNEIKEL